MTFPPYDHEREDGALDRIIVIIAIAGILAIVAVCKYAPEVFA